MAESTFPGAAGASSNPFGDGGTSGTAAHLGGTRSAMQRVMEEDEHDAVASPTSPVFKLGGPHGSASSPGPVAAGPGSSPSASTPPSSFSPTSASSQGFPSNYSMGRRTSVSAESMNPTTSMSDTWTPPFHPKSQEQLSRLQSAVAGNFLFSHLDEEQTSQVLGALVEKPIPTKDIKVITQGDVGDYFYVVEKGTFRVYVHPSGAFQPGPEGIGQHVGTIGTGGSFGELALMYNAPRAATVISTEAGSCLWALDRVTFRRILMDSTFQRRRMYENFLEEVPLLSSLTPYERSKIADALDAQKFPPGSTIIQEGDPGEAFFILESGEADVYKRGIARPVMSYKKGDYFGELALLNNAPRAASVVSKTEVKLATLGKDGFQRLLGPVEGIMRRNDPTKRGIKSDEEAAAVEDKGPGEA
ncbi:MAG: suppresor of mar1-1 [Thelocarpon superellum]|nr:MAG: suppresor of mar1-1 [Thelocarpon superellum]